MGLVCIRVFPYIGVAEGELGLALLRRGRVLRNKLHNVQIVLIAADTAFANDMHDARKNIGRAAAEAANVATQMPHGVSFLTRVQHL